MWAIPKFGDFRNHEAGDPETFHHPLARLTKKRLVGERPALQRDIVSQEMSERGVSLHPMPLPQIGVIRSMDESNRAPDDADRTGVQALAGEIDDRLSSLRHPATAELRQIRREFSKRLKDAAPHVVIELGMLLLELPQFEYRFTAYELIHHHPNALSHLNAWQLERLGRGIASWAAVDCYAVFLAGPVWRERHVPNSLIHGWARSADRWWRRAALVSTVPLNSKARGGSGDAYRTLQVCRLLERDPDPMVAKALSWALRELAKRDPRAAREYLSNRSDVLPAIVLREVSNKLRTGLKNPKSK
jgi:3-methyladenine DNA glycosylase AlkD